MTGQRKENQVAMFERELRNLRRNIMGVVEAGQQATADDASFSAFEAHFDSAEGYWQRFQDVWRDLDRAYFELDPSAEIPETTWQLHDAARDEMRQADGLLRALRDRRARDNLPKPAAPASEYPPSSLPRMSIPKFDGNLFKWTQFRDAFLSLVHNSRSIPNVDKMHHLREALVGEPATLLAGLSYDGSSYPQAWNALMREYDNPRVLATRYLQKILTYKCPLSGPDHTKYKSFLSQVAENIESFRALNLEGPDDVILSILALRALDPTTRRQFEISNSDNDFPTVDDVVGFVRRRLMACKLSADFQEDRPEGLNRSFNTRSKPPSRSAPRYGAPHGKVETALVTSSGQSNSTASETGPPASVPQETSRPSPQGPPHKSSSPDRGHARKQSCAFCQGNHFLNKCPTFSDVPIQARIDFAKAWTGCHNCLNPEHKVSQCPSRFRCRRCGSPHHTLLHPAENITQGPSSTSNSLAGQIQTGSALQTSAATWPDTQAIMGTAQTLLEGPSSSTQVRALLDSGSQFTFVTAEIAAKLRGTIKPFDGQVTGLGGCTVNTIRGWVVLRLRSMTSEAQFRVKALVVDRITSETPRRPLHRSILPRLTASALADPSFTEPGPVDMLIGVNLYPHLITGAPFPSGIDGLFLLPSVLGNIVMGSVPSDLPCYGHTLLAQDTSTILKQLQAFWEVEEPGPVDRSDPSDVACENFFQKTHSRTPEGRYVVRLPIKPGQGSPTGNRDLALRRFYSLERKLQRDRLLKEEYIHFMQEYSSLGHMTPTSHQAAYVIPHHGVWQEKPCGIKKLRVVFDASCSAGAKSLNDTLERGPKLLNDLTVILINFRLHPIALTADLVKMYRQVLVHPENRQLQHVFWREDPSLPVVEYELLTVTYGLTSSSYLAIRTILQLAEDEGQKFPMAAERARGDMYVDDIVTGASSVEEALELKRQLIELFHRGGFELSKWASNEPSLLSDCPQPAPAPADFNGDDIHLKILGLVWHPMEDIFSFSVRTPVTQITKRNILSAIARVFDPLGFLTPVILYAKSLLKEAWRCELPWDEPLPSSLCRAWSLLIQDWATLEQVKVPRYVQASRAQLQLMGFCDASSKGYAAAVYLRVVQDETATNLTFLLKAKSKVAPNKFHTIAQLELCGALLLQRVVNSIEIYTHHAPMYFTDSSVVLAWLNTPSHQLKVFEANRVSAILKHSTVDQWHHCRSELNPADVASRGCLPSELLSHHLWWHGPRPTQLEQLIHGAPQESPRHEEVGQALLTTADPSNAPWDSTWMTRASSLQRLVRCTAYVRRFISRAKGPFSGHLGPIDASEYDSALHLCIRVAQHSSFPCSLFQGKIPPSMQNLRPFIDDLGEVRVGGRLKHSDLSYERKHPSLLPRDHHLTKLIIDDIHTRNSHTGPTLTLSLLRGRFWVPSALKVIKSRILKCVKCRIFRARPAVPIMGDLPSERLHQDCTFSQVGVDYAGPFTIRDSLRRKAATSKAYLCLFVCFATKAVHLELVSSLSTEAFLATLDRFTARRGLPTTIHSDNATNFVGASNYLQDLYAFIRNNCDALINHLVPKGVTWQFIPPRSPHFGGLWEAGIKSAKSLLTRVSGSHPLTFEELSTILARIEGLLNSRPLCPLSEDPESFDFLTPGHFLIGRPIMAIPEPSPNVRKPPLSARWPLVQHQITTIWSRWQKEYLHQLQQRTRWTKDHPNLAVGDLVVLMDYIAAPATWPVARVTEVFPGEDGKVRVVNVRTPAGKIFKRATAKLAPLFSGLE